MERLKIKKIIFGQSVLILIFMFCVLSFVESVSAQKDLEYKVLAPLPGIADKPGETTTINKYIPAIFQIAVGVAAVFAVLMIVLGGIQYMSTDAYQGKEDGKNRAWNAVKGLLFIIAAYLILYTINPKLLEFNLNIETIEIKPPTAGEVTAGRILTAAEIAESNAVRASLEGRGIYTYRDVCAGGQISNCVNLNGLTTNTQTGLGNLRDAVRSDIVITGGTEGGHSMTGGHPAGNSVDFGFARPQNSAITTFVNGSGVTPRQTSLGPDEYSININGSNVKFLKESDHWHVTFP